MTIYTDENMRDLFRVVIVDDGSYMAIRDESPKFALHGKTIQECCAKAESALQFYKDTQTGT